MEILNLEGTADTPKIILDKGNGIFEISGRSLPEDSVEFYGPVLEWISNYAKAPNATTHFSFKLEYFNTSSSKDRKSTRLNSSHSQISYAVFCLKKKKKTQKIQ